MAAQQEKPRRVRRSAEEVRPILLASARDLFLTKGFHATGTRDIAARAGVAETMLFRYCGSKVKLYEDVILEPFQKLMRSHLDSWERNVSDDQRLEDVIRTFVTGFYMLVRQHRELFLLLGCARVHEDDPLYRAANDVAEQVAKSLLHVEFVTSQKSADQHLSGLDSRLSVAMACGLVTSLAVFDDVLIPGPPLSASHVVNEITNMILHRVTHRPTASGA